MRVNHVIRAFWPFSVGKNVKTGSQKVRMKQNYEYFLILDFEATCEKFTLIKPQEIIEFPCLKLNTKTWEVESTFHQYVKPKFKPTLTPFCTELTGILQEMVDDQPHFEKCLESFDSWVNQENLLDCKFAFITHGAWDLKIMLPNQCKLCGLEVPSYMREWIDIKMSYAEVYGDYGGELKMMLKKLKLPHEGRLHSGIDDCKNIANVVRSLAMTHPLRINSRL